MLRVIRSQAGLAHAPHTCDALPVVAARSGAFPEVIQEGRTGFLFEPGNVEALALALERLILDDDLRTSLGLAGRTQALQSFTVSRMADDFVAALHLP